ncbi:MAG: CBS domain-containing protein, partial [Actinomycetota bacterium]|nr:CBS domain-containing protein [Actinomycetota bacterium]
MHDIAEFLKDRDPFASLDEAELEGIAQRTEVEFFVAGATIFRQGEPTPSAVRVVRRGAIELVKDGRVLDVLGEGELFGHPWMLSGLPTGFEARAGEDSLCYKLDSADVVPLLSRPSNLPYLARSLLARGRVQSGHRVAGAATVELTQQPAGALVHLPAIICTPEVPVREAARRMVEEGVSSILVRAPDDSLGIVTDRDVRSKVVAVGLPVETPVGEVMTTPVITVGAEQAGAEVILAMLDNDVRHLPVLSGRSDVLGVLTDVDLIAAEAHTPFVLRRSIADARDKEELRAAATRL